ncbi:MAG: DUF1553 domain-containing protein [Planctomycetota bacterium]|jgi:hypothetical protein
MKRLTLVALTLMMAVVGWGAESRTVPPFEAEGGFAAESPVDAAVLAGLEERSIEPAARCSDAVFVRRVYLDVIGTLPTAREVVAFLRDRRPGKRGRLIDALLTRDEFADYWSLKWCDLLRVKAEFPINLWPNAVQAYHRWVHDSIRENKPYDRFARELLTSSGSNFRVPPVNFYRAIQGRGPDALARAAALTFMGVRTESWPEARRAGLAAFFSRVSYKRTVEWKEEIVFPTPAPDGPLEATFPDGMKARIAADEDPRRVFADWLIRPENPWFTRSVVNRVWAWLMGRGIVHEPDDFRPDNPPMNPVLLGVLSKELVDARYDLRHLYRLILNSSTYQQSSIPRSDHPEAEARFAHYIVRRLDAEVLIDALCGITGTSEKYMSAIPEPFTFIPDEQRSIALADGSITSPFLEMFGRPARDTGLASERNNEPTAGQRLHLLNSTDIQRRIERSWKLAGVVRSARGDARRAIRALYLHILSREPTPQELAVAERYAKATRLSPKQAAEDLAWALINTKEFLYRH